VVWLPHLYTASGAVLGFLALLAVAAGDARQAFLWMFAATVVDATDGWLARRFRVADRLPALDGARLDDIVDYVTYVFVPAYLVYATGLLPPRAALAVASAMLLASAYGFARTDAKTSDHFFTGFPSYWNVLALYLYVGGLAAWGNALLLTAGCALVFVRTRWVYPSRTPRLWPLTIALAAIWGGQLLWLIWRLPDRSGLWLAATLVFPAYYVWLSVTAHRARRT
jgi:phosphatidylcholine synthase